MRKHGQHLGVDASQVTIERLAQTLRRGLGHGHGNSEHGVRAQLALVARAVELDQRVVDEHLIVDLEAGQRGIDQTIDVAQHFLHALATVTFRVLVTKLQRLA